MSQQQKTIAASFQLSGVSLHSGKETTVICSPAPINSGIHFKKQGKSIPATIEHLSSTKRSTSVAGVAVTEHLLSAIYALGIDNLTLEVKGDEIPVLDGSAKPFVDAFLTVGLLDQPAPKQAIILKAPIKLSADKASVEALPYHGFRLTFMVNFPSVGEQKLSFDLESGDYATEIAPARTFGYIEEIEALKQQGLGRGASLDNALVLSQNGYLNQPRFKDELVRHKILDLIGDLALLGKPLKAQIVACMSGHKLNSELVRRILQNG